MQFAQQLHQRLSEVRTREDRLLLLQSAGLAVMAVIAFAGCALVAEQFLFLSPIVRSILVVLLPIGGVAVFTLHSGPALARALHLRGEESDETTARRVGRILPGVEDKIVNALQLSRDLETGAYNGYSSPSLLAAATGELEQELRPISFASIVTASDSRRAWKRAGIVTAAVLVIFLISPAAFLGSVYRFLHPGEAFAAPVPFRLLIEPGNREVIKGESVPVRIHAVGAAPDHVTLVSRLENESTNDERVLSASPDGLFRAEFTGLRATTRYTAVAGDVRSDEYVLTVIDRPLVRQLQLTVHPPPYTGLPVQELDVNAGDATVLKGSRVAFQLESNKELSSAALLFSDSASTALRVAGNRATGDLVAFADRTYHVLLVDSGRVSNANPVEYAITVLPDAYPSVTILSPASDLAVTDKSAVPLAVRISDDFGFSSLRLAFKLIRSRYEQPAKEFTLTAIPLPGHAGTEAVVSYQWMLEGLRLVPEDVVSYHVEVTDNDRVSGPKTSVSESFTLRLPSMEEVFAAADKAQDTSQQTLTSALEEAEQARQDLEHLLQETRTDKQKMDWQEQQKAEQLAKKYGEIQKKLDDVHKTMDRMLQDMGKNNLLSQETMQKYMELQNLMEQMDSPEFREAMQQLQQSMQQVSPEAMRKALEQFSFSEETFRKGIERTMNLLKRIQIEQKMDQALKEMQAMQQKQQDLHEQTSSLHPADTQQAGKIAEQQKDLARKAADEAKALKDLQQRMEEFPGETPLADMEKMNQQMDRQQLDAQLQAIAQQLDRQQQTQAMQGQQQAMQQMGRMQQQLQSMKQAMQQNQSRQVMEAMKKNVQDLLELSKREEELKNQSRTLEQNSPQFRENARRQNDVLSDLNRLAARMSSLGEKSFAVTPEMAKTMGDAARMMGDALKRLEERVGSPASEKQEDAMASLNEGAALMQDAMAAMQKSGGQAGGGMAGFLQRLKQLAGQQEGINQGTKQAGEMSQQQAAAMARLAAEQGAVRKSLEQLNREAAASGDLNRMLGDLSKVAQDMREVQTDLAQNNANPETQRKQDRILSRLLDAQRSTRERDFEQRRKSESGRDILGNTPRPLDLATQEGKDRLRRDLLRALEAGYARDYEELIRKYFDALQQAQ